MTRTVDQAVRAYTAHKARSAALPAKRPSADPVYVLPGKHHGMVEKGNIDLAHRPVVRNPDGSISTVESISISVNGHEVLIPRVFGNKTHSVNRAVRHYQRTGRNLGVFRGVHAANRYAKRLHRQQASYYGA